MNKNVKGAIAGAIALILIGGGIYFGVQASKKGAQCPFCKKYFPHGDIMGHKLKCSKNETDLDLTPKPGSKTKPAEEKPETKPEGKGNKNGEAEKPAETKPKNSDGEGKKPAEQGDGEKE